MIKKTILLKLMLPFELFFFIAIWVFVFIEYTPPNETQVQWDANQVWQWSPVTGYLALCLGFHICLAPFFRTTFLKLFLGFSLEIFLLSITAIVVKVSTALLVIIFHCRHILSANHMAGLTWRTRSWRWSVIRPCTESSIAASNGSEMCHDSSILILAFSSYRPWSLEAYNVYYCQVRKYLPRSLQFWILIHRPG